MFNSSDKDRQAEFFSDLANSPKKPGKSKFRLARIVMSLSYENIFIVSIGLIMLFIVCYSLGVERGKHLVWVKDEVLDIKQEQVKEKVKEPVSKPDPPCIQVASFRTDKYARKETERLKDKGYESFVTASGKFRVVCVGGYKDSNEAKQALKQLRKLYADCFLRN